MTKRAKRKINGAGPTPKQVVRSRQTTRQNRNVFIGLIALGIVLVGLLAAGLIQEFAIKPGAPVAIVEGSKIRTDEFQKRARFEYDSVRRQLYQWQQLKLQYGSDEDSSGYFDQQITQLQAQLDDPAALSEQVMEQMIEEQLILKKAQEEGLQVSEEEIVAETERQFGFVPNPTPTPIVTPAVITSTQVITGTDGVTTTQVVSATATPRPTVDLMTEEEYLESYSSSMTSLSETVGFSEADFRKLIEISLLEQKLRTKIGEGVSTTEEQVRARHILISPDAEAEDATAAEQAAAQEAQGAYARLQAGEDFATLALELSDDTGTKDSGGDLGWFGRGQMMSEFEEKAFTLALEQVSEPFTTTYGYHIIQVLEKDPARQVDEYTLSQRQSQAFEDWLQERLATANIERFWSLDKVPPTPTVGAVPG